METLTETKLAVESAEERMIKKATYVFVESLRAALNDPTLTIEITAETSLKSKIEFMNECNPALIFNEKPESHLTGNGFTVSVVGKDNGLPF